MQCVILAAGLGSRMMPLTQNTPKPLLRVSGKPILEHIITALPQEIEEVVLVVGYKGEVIREYFGDFYCGKKMTYYEQTHPAAGSGVALLCAKDILQGRFMFLYGDDILGREGLDELTNHQYAVSTYFMENLGRFGSVMQNEDGTMNKIMLGRYNPPEGKSGFAYIGGAVLDTNIFSYVNESNRCDETLLIDLLNAFAKEYEMSVVEQEMWLPIGFPEDIEKAEAVLNGQ